MDRGPELRRCIACGAEKAIHAYHEVGHFNCVTGSIPKALGRPKECWFFQHPTIAEPFLAALYPVKAHGKTTNAFFDRKVAFAKAVMLLEQQNKLTADSLKPIVDSFGRANAGKFISALPDGYQIKSKLVILLRRTRSPKPSKLPKDRKAEPELINLPQEFEKALLIWSDISHRRAERKLKAGNNYDEKTPARRVKDARRFLEFLVKNGVHSWANVSQIHLDEFTVTHTRRLAQLAFAFWHAIRTHFPMHAKLVRPRNEKDKSITERTVSEDQFKSILKTASLCKDTEVSLCIFITLLYAQTILKATNLTLDQIRLQQGKYQIRFNEIWVPIDPMTERALKNRLSEIEQDSWGYEVSPNAKIFSSSANHLYIALRRATGVDARKLRLTAVRKILLNGYTDRKGIELSLGVTMETVRSVERSCGFALQDYVPEEARKLRKDLLDGKLS